MKTINLELSKRLSPYLENVETENSYIQSNKKKYYYIWELKELYTLWKINWNNPITMRMYKIKNRKIYKTFTLEEAIEFIKTTKDWISLNIAYSTMWNVWCVSYNTWMDLFAYIQKDISLLEAIEAMILYLLNNDLLWTKNKEKKEKNK